MSYLKVHWTTAAAASKERNQTDKVIEITGGLEDVVCIIYIILMSLIDYDGEQQNTLIYWHDWSS